LRALSRNFLDMMLASEKAIGVNKHKITNWFHSHHVLPARTSSDA
jgi:hypothetical protein